MGRQFKIMLKFKSQAHVNLKPSSATCSIVPWGGCLVSAQTSELTELGLAVDPEMHFPDPLAGLKSLVFQLLGIFTMAGSQLSPLWGLPWLKVTSPTSQLLLGAAFSQ